jgi:group I intron endonuclease
MIIYKTTNLINGKIYVGKDSNNNPKYLGSGKYLNNSIKKYGKENFVKEIICECFCKEELNKKEKYWIEFYDCKDPNGYNLTDGGDGGPRMFGDKNPMKRIEVRSKLFGDKNPTRRPEVAMKISKTKTGMGSHPQSILSRKKTSESMKGKNTGPHSEEIKKKQSDSHKGKIPWNKGKKTGPQSKETIEKRVRTRRTNKIIGE